MADKKKRHIEDKRTDPFAEYFISGEPGRTTKTVSSRTKANITRLYDEFNNEKVMGEKQLVKLLKAKEYDVIKNFSSLVCPVNVGREFYGFVMTFGVLVW